jgi:hypothetical protein
VRALELTCEERQADVARLQLLGQGDQFDARPKPYRRPVSHDLAAQPERPAA